MLAERFLSDAENEAGASDRYLVTVHIDRSELSEGIGASAETPSRDRQRGRSDIEDGPTLAAETARRLSCDGPIVGIVEDDDGEPLNIGRKTRAISPALKRALASRDGGCRFPSCNRTRFTEGHHIHHWADGGETKLTNLITLCRFHHRLLHEGGFGLRVTDDGLFVFSRPDGSRIADAGCFRGNISGDSRRALGLSDLNKRDGLKIDSYTIRPNWTGESMDSSLVLDALVRLWERPQLSADVADRS